MSKVLVEGFVDGVMLENFGFQQCEEMISFGIAKTMTYKIIFNKVIKDNKRYTIFIGFVNQIIKYDITKKLNVHYKRSELLAYKKTKRRSYSGYIWGAEIVYMDIKPHVKDLIKKGYIKELEK